MPAVKVPTPLTEQGVPEVSGATHLYQIGLSNGADPVSVTVSVVDHVAFFNTTDLDTCVEALKDALDNLTGVTVSHFVRVETTQEEVDLS